MHIECVRYPIGVQRRGVARVDEGRNEALQQEAPNQANSLLRPLRICAFQDSSQSSDRVGVGMRQPARRECRPTIETRMSGRVRDRSGVSECEVPR